MVGSWRLRGDLKIDLLAPESVLIAGRTVSVSGSAHIVERLTRSGREYRLKLAGINSREEARSLRGAYIQVRESDLDRLPEGEYYRFQLIGLAVRSLDGRELGRVTDVLSTPETDVYVVSGPTGEVLIPAVDDVVQEINLEHGTITIEIVPGLLP